MQGLAIDSQRPTEKAWHGFVIAVDGKIGAMPNGAAAIEGEKGVGAVFQEITAQLLAQFEQRTEISGKTEEVNHHDEGHFRRGFGAQVVEINGKVRFDPVENGAEARTGDRLNQRRAMEGGEQDNVALTFGDGLKELIERAAGVVGQVQRTTIRERVQIVAAAGEEVGAAQGWVRGQHRIALDTSAQPFRRRGRR